MKEWKIILGFAIPVVVGFLALSMLILHESERFRRGGPPPERLIELAEELEAKQLWKAAAKTYIRYLDIAVISDEERSKVNYNLGLIYLDRLNSPDDAIPFLVMAHKLAIDVEFKNKINVRVKEAVDQIK